MADSVIFINWPDPVEGFLITATCHCMRRPLDIECQSQRGVEWSNAKLGSDKSASLNITSTHAMVSRCGIKRVVIQDVQGLGCKRRLKKDFYYHSQSATLANKLPFPR
jgi:hypothetical protein